MAKYREKKICIAMSGGVDSSVAAAILKNQGFNCVGIFMKFWNESESTVDNKCCSVDSYNDARKIANKLGFPLYTLNFKKDFKKIVVDEFIKEYQQGNTPNPCIRCNKFIKFGLLLKKTKILGCDVLATGHYAKIVKNKNNFKLLAGKDKNKDQSYFLYNLKQNQLKNLIFPLGGLTKSEVRILAKTMKLPVYEKSESQEICFVPEKNHYPFLKRHLKLKAGPIKNLKNEILGSHDGLPLYTIGQRQGIKIGGIGPFYVVRLDYKKNILFVSNNHNDRLLQNNKFQIKNLNWISGVSVGNNEKIGVKIRYQQKTIPCALNKNIVTLKKPARAIMTGQSAVFYKGQEVLGGGIINKVYSN